MQLVRAEQRVAAQDAQRAEDLLHPALSQLRAVDTLGDVCLREAQLARVLAREVDEFQHHVAVLDASLGRLFSSPMSQSFR